ncbi:hypothetical protein INT45_003559 [Circinella minor]|uniref:Transcription activator GCR1-like domain-containing protein n=1 Tax=Circinella minor TaxID=1195481 RepID=A0A8H7S376_9FUNG|nr:hypothetical protein INT45_003559 [Circinella minor]
MNEAPTQQDLTLQMAMPLMHDYVRAMHTDVSARLASLTHNMEQQAQRTSQFLDDLLSGHVPFSLQVDPSYIQNSYQSFTPSTPFTLLPITMSTAAINTTISNVGIPAQHTNNTPTNNIITTSSTADDPPHYKMSRGITNLYDLWREWHTGLSGSPAVLELERTWKTKWRRGDDKWVNRRATIVCEIQTYKEKYQLTPEAALKEIDDRHIVLGSFKRHVKSRASPGVNAGNIIKRQLIMRNFERMYNPDVSHLSILLLVFISPDELLDEQPEENDYSLEGYPEAELWDCCEGSIYDFLEDFDMQEYIKKYWHNQFPNDRALTTPISTTIRVGKRLFMYGHTLYRCQKYPSTARNLDILSQGQERPLCLVKLYLGVTVDKYGTTTWHKGGIPHVHCRAVESTPGDKLYVTDVENIKSYAGMLKSSLVDYRFYLIYPEMIPGDVKVTELPNMELCVQKFGQDVPEVQFVQFVQKMTHIKKVVYPLMFWKSPMVTTYKL